MKLYYCHTENTDISYLETTNDLAENSVDKPTNKEITTLFDYLKLKKPC